MRHKMVSATSMMAIVWRNYGSLLFIIGGLYFFAFFIHHPFPKNIPAIAGLIISAVIIGKNSREWSMITGQQRNSRIIMAYSFLGIISASTLVVSQRLEAGISLLPSTITSFSILAIMIGLVEELVFRGYIQSSLKRFPLIAAIICSAMVHAGYKAILFLSPELIYTVDSLSIFKLTFVGGLFLASLRAFSGSVWPAAVAHMLYDLLIYGSNEHAPWWVW